MSRDPNRCYGVGAKVWCGWRLSAPDQRFCQFIMNFFAWVKAKDIDPFYLEDEEFLKYFQDYCESIPRFGKEEKEGAN